MYNKTTDEWFKDYKIEKEIRDKENKNKLEKLYLEMDRYNGEITEINVDFSKKHITEKTKNELRVKNTKECLHFLKTEINKEAMELFQKISSIEDRIILNREVSNFEYMLYKEFGIFKNNIFYDFIILLSYSK